MATEGIQRLGEGDEVARDEARALVDELVEGMLAVRAGFAPVDRAGISVHFGAVELNVLAVAFHRELLQVGWEALINKRGTTWKLLPAELQQNIQTKAAAFELIIQKPSIIKRPILESNGQILLGFDENQYAFMAYRTVTGGGPSDSPDKSGKSNSSSGIVPVYSVPIALYKSGYLETLTVDPSHKTNPRGSVVLWKIRISPTGFWKS